MVALREDIGDAYVGVADAAMILDKKRSNVAKFLKLRGIKPRATKQPGGSALYLREDVERAKREYDADERKREIDARRRATARGEPRVVTRPPRAPRPPVAGATQRRALELLSAGPVAPATAEDGQALRLAMRRLAERGLVRIQPGTRPAVYELTAEGQQVHETLRGGTDGD